MSNAQTYTLTNDDVEVNEEGLIISCSYDFEYKFITIPDVLDGQAVTKISDAVVYDDNPPIGPFVNKEIEEVVLPSGLEYIGWNAFRDNNIRKIIIPANVETIWIQAFAENSAMDSVVFEENSKLMFVGYYAFPGMGDVEASLPLNINEGFEYWVDGKGNVLNPGDKLDSYVSYFAKVPYTLTDEDVVVEEGMIKSCSYDFSSKFIIVPEVLDGQTITAIDNSTNDNLIFSKQSVVDIELPVTLKSIGRKAFMNDFLFFFDISKYSNLESIGDYAFYSCDFNSAEIPSSVKTIGQNAFQYNYNLKSVTFQTPSHVSLIDYGAFPTLTEGLILPEPVKDGYIFEHWLDYDDNIIQAGESVSAYSNSFTAVFKMDESAYSISVTGDLSFGEIEIGSTGDASLSITNTGTNPITVNEIQIPEGYSIDWQSGTIDVNQSQNVMVTFAPTEVKNYNGDIKIMTNIESITASLAVTGAGFEKELTYPVSFSGNTDFGEVEIDQTLQTVVTITNTGEGEINISNIDLPEGFSADWTQTKILSGESKELVITFSPTDEKQYNGTVDISADVTLENTSFDVSGTGIKTTAISDGVFVACKVYPNPATNMVTIEVSEIIKRVKVFNQYGQLLLTENYKNTEKTSLNLENINQRLLYIEITTLKGNKYIEKLISK